MLPPAIHCIKSTACGVSQGVQYMVHGIWLFGEGGGEVVHWFGKHKGVGGRGVGGWGLKAEYVCRLVLCFRSLWLWFVEVPPNSGRLLRNVVVVGG